MAKAIGGTANDALEAQYAEVEAWYRHELSLPAPPPETHLYPPITIGPSWQRTEDGHWLLPEHTLGWRLLAWCGVWLKDAESDEPWQFTLEQARIILWWYAVDETGRFLFDDAVIQRLKGWGKDPLGACLCLIEAFGPCRFSHWAAAEPVGKENESAWVQTCGVALDQTKNTMKLFPGLMTAEFKRHYGVTPGKVIFYGLGDTRTVEAVTQSPTKLEGARGSFVLLNETHHWQTNNDGLAMADVIERNAAKSKGGAARTMRITNAPEPSLESVGLRDREAYEALAESDSTVASRIMYDSLEAGPDAPLTEEAAPHVLRAVRGDSWWLDIERIVGSIFDPRNPASRSRRFWYNQLVASEEAWVVPQDFESLADKEIVVGPKEPIVIFFDGSKSDDATGLIGCRVSDGHVFTLGMWQRPPRMERGQDWIVPRYAVDQRVDEVFETYNVVGFWGDPSHTLEDETQERYWDTYFDKWHRKYKDRLQIWAIPSKHSIMWDMASPQRVAEFTAAAERCVAEIETAAATLRGEAQGAPFTHDGDGRLKTHVRNAQRYPNKWGVSLWKGHRESKRKIDLAVCMVGARMLRRALLNTEVEPKKRPGRIWGVHS